MYAKNIPVLLAQKVTSLLCLQCVGKKVLFCVARVLLLSEMITEGYEQAGEFTQEH